MNLIVKVSCLLLGLIAGLKTAQAQIHLPTEIKAAQARFGNHSPEYPIIIFDQDEIDWRFMQAQLTDYQDREQSQARTEIIRDYIFEVTGKELTLRQVLPFESYLTLLKDSAFALPLTQTRQGKLHYEICAVFPASANSNKRLEHERLLGFNIEGVYQDQNYENLKPTLEYDQLLLFSLYHEISHCLDPEFMPKMYSRGEDAYTLHQAESFAESLAALILHQRGIKNITQIRGYHRTLYARMVGKHLANQTQPGFGHPFVKAMGAIYNLEASLRGIGQLISSRRHDIENLDIEQLIGLTIDVVKKQATDMRGFQAIINSLETKNLEATITLYEQRALDWPEMFYDAYIALIEFHHYTPLVVASSFADRQVNFNPGQAPLEPIDYLKLCQFVQQDDQQSYFLALESLRLNLHQTKASIEEQRKRAQELILIDQKLRETCF